MEYRRKREERIAATVGETMAVSDEDRALAAEMGLLLDKTDAFGTGWGGASALSFVLLRPMRRLDGPESLCPDCFLFRELGD
jgi:hypothetical protein